jgi:predicted transglutaminase-like cysteine proteinase
MTGGLQDVLVQGIGRRTLLVGGLATLLLTRVRESHARSYAMFRVRAPNLEARYRDWWNRAEGFAEDLVTSEHPRVVQFRLNLTAMRKNLGLFEFIRTVNNAVNAAAPYVEDYRSGPEPDQWASPIEFLDRGGDCEDFALTKAATLYSLGWPFNSTYLLIGELNRPPAKPTGHAVLIVILGNRQSDHLVLDNISDRVVSLGQYKGFRPISGLHRQGVTMFLPLS